VSIKMANITEIKAIRIKALTSLYFLNN